MLLRAVLDGGPSCLDDQVLVYGVGIPTWCCGGNAGRGRSVFDWYRFDALDRPRGGYMDGAAIYLAGRNLDFITDRGYTSYFEMDSENSEVNSLIDNSVMLVDRIVGQATERQVPILYDRLKGKTEVEIARSLSISQGAVNQRAMNAGWPFIKHTLTL